MRWNPNPTAITHGNKHTMRRGQRDSPADYVFDWFRLSDQLRSGADSINDFGVIHVADPKTWLFRRFKNSHMCRQLYVAVLCY
ncbi:hypothetical protein MTR_1g041755 [Medicago truncatula]|uniref:Uncharacterized protein n=1 Tax=Medicago truncatula TaxID=3880 RepID=A0A072VSJ4_MEDTR|nr:hypothetical protein MTR_1g041755 [Medicago truncatula]